MSAVTSVNIGPAIRRDAAVNWSPSLSSGYGTIGLTSAKALAITIDHGQWSDRFLSQPQLVFRQVDCGKDD